MGLQVSEHSHQDFELVHCRDIVYALYIRFRILFALQMQNCNYSRELWLQTNELFNLLKEHSGQC